MLGKLAICSIASFVLGCTITHKYFSIGYSYVTTTGTNNVLSINRKIYRGNTITASNNRVYIDGIEQKDGYASADSYNHTFNVEITGDSIGKVETTDNVIVHGDCGDITTTGRVSVDGNSHCISTTGSVTIGKSCLGNINTLGHVIVGKQK